MTYHPGLYRNFKTEVGRLYPYVVVLSDGERTYGSRFLTDACRKKYNKKSGHAPFTEEEKEAVSPVSIPMELL